MEETGDERPILDDLRPKGRAEIRGRAVPSGEEPSLGDDLRHLRDHIQTLEEAARTARAVEFDQLRSVISQLELVAEAAKQAEGDLARELSDTSRISVATGRLVRQRLALALRALSDALAVAADEHVDTI